MSVESARMRLSTCELGHFVDKNLAFAFLDSLISFVLLFIPFDSLFKVSIAVSFLQFMPCPLPSYVSFVFVSLEAHSDRLGGAHCFSR